MNSPPSINVVASSAAVIPDNVDLQVERGAAIHNHAEEEPVYGFHLPPFMTTTTEQSKNHQAYVNPFLPPPIKNSILNKIEEGVH